MVTTFPAVLSTANGFDDRDGIPISYIGDDGTMIALGHHDPAAAKAAFDKHDGPVSYHYPIEATWAVLTDPPAHECVPSLTISCFVCEETEGVPWWMQWTGVTADTPGAFPVMVVEA
jgi:hypothetical protein